MKLDGFVVLDFDALFMCLISERNIMTSFIEFHQVQELFLLGKGVGQEFNG